MSLAHQSLRPLAGHQGAPLRLAAGGHDLGSGEDEDGGHAGKQGGTGEASAGFDAADDSLDSYLGLGLGPISAQFSKGWRWHVCFMTFLQPNAKPFYNLTPRAELHHNAVMGIGSRVAQAMERAGLQQEDVAARLNVSQTIVSRIITGKMPGKKHHDALAKILGVSREWIAAGDPAPVPIAPDVGAEILKEIRQLRAEVRAMRADPASDSAGLADLVQITDRNPNG